MLLIFSSYFETMFKVSAFFDFQSLIAFNTVLLMMAFEMNIYFKKTEELKMEIKEKNRFLKLMKLGYRFRY